MPRKEYFKEMLKDVPEMSQEEKDYIKEIMVRQMNNKPKKKLKDFSDEELLKLEQDVKDSQVYVELHAPEFKENLDFARSTLRSLIIQINLEKELRKLN